MKDRKKRYNYTSEEKVTLLKRHLVDRVPVSDICDQNNLQPTVFYRWQKEFFQNGAAAFQKSNKRKKKQNERRIKALEKKLQTKNEVLSELMEEHIKLKKNLGSECIRPGVLLSLDDARQVVGHSIDYYNNIRLNSAIPHFSRTLY